MNRPSLVLFLCALLCCCALNTRAQFPTIELQTLSKRAAQIGSTVELNPVGARLDELDGLRFSRNHLTATPITTEAPLLATDRVPTGRFLLKVSPDVPAGVYEVRGLGRFGLSNPRPFLVTRHPVEHLESDHSDPALAARLDSARIYSGQFRTQQYSYFHVTLGAGDRLRVVVYAQALDSKAIPALMLRGSGGKEIARSRAMGAWPAEIAYEASEPEELILAVHDFLFQGGEGFHFVMESSISSKQTDEPLELDELLRPVLDRPPSIYRFANPASLNPHLSSAQAVNPLAVGSDAPLTAPFSVHRTFDDAQSEYFFQAAKGQSLTFELISSQLQQLTDPRIVLYQTQPVNGSYHCTQQLKEQDDGTSTGGPDMRIRMRDPCLEWTAPEDGVYAVKLTDNENGSRPLDARGYILNVRPSDPGFYLLAQWDYPDQNRASAKPAGSKLMRGGTLAVRVMAFRKGGFDGPIEVLVRGLPESVRCPAAIIPAGAVETALVLEAREDAQNWNGTLEIIGREFATGDASGSVRVGEVNAAISTVCQATSATRNAIQSRLTADLSLFVDARDLAPLQVQLGSAEDESSQRPLEVVAGNQLQIPVRVLRRDGGKVACLMRPQNLPAKTSLADVNIAADKEEGTAELKVAGDAAPGTYTFWLLNEVKLKWSANPEALVRAEKYLSVLENAVNQQNSSDAAASQPLQAALQSQKEKVEALKKQTAPQDITVWMPTSTVRLKILPAQTSSGK